MHYSEKDRVEFIDPRTIIEGERMRQDYGDVTALADSMKEHGVIQPLVIHDENNELIAGGRRRKAAIQAGIAVVPVFRRANVPEWLALTMEYEENARRKNCTWQEDVLAVERIHAERAKTGALAGDKWGITETATLLGISIGKVSYCTRLAEEIRRKNVIVLNASGPVEAFQNLAVARAKELSAQVAVNILPTQKSRVAVPVVPGAVQPAPNLDDGLDDEAYVPPEGLLCDICNMDALSYLTAIIEGRTARRPDHIYTDPPYAINMDMLEQSATYGMDVASVRETHVVADNLVLLRDFISRAYVALPDHGFLVMWCDIDNWQFMKDCAITAGFRVQRWPLHWIKSSPCQNGAPYANFTKSVEHAILCAKPKATLNMAGTNNFFIEGSDKRKYEPTNPFWKPLSLHQWVMRNIARLGAVVCDPFAGSGSIPLAALESERDVMCNELDPVHYVDMVKRLELFKPTKSV
jgi:DNA modification methylase